MSLVERLQQSADPDYWDHVPSQEEALGQFLYDAILGFVGDDPEALVDLLLNGGPPDHYIHDFVNRWAALGGTLAGRTAEEPKP